MFSYSNSVCTKKLYKISQALFSWVEYHSLFGCDFESCIQTILSKKFAPWFHNLVKILFYLDIVWHQKLYLSYYVKTNHFIFNVELLNLIYNKSHHNIIWFTFVKINLQIYLVSNNLGEKFKALKKLTNFLFEASQDMDIKLAPLNSLQSSFIGVNPLTTVVLLFLLHGKTWKRWASFV